MLVLQLHSEANPVAGQLGKKKPVACGRAPKRMRAINCAGLRAGLTASMSEATPKIENAPHRLHRGWVALACLVVGMAWWWLHTPKVETADLEFTYRDSGVPVGLIFVVRNEAGRPVPGVTVNSLSNSGWAQQTRTDTNGVAIIRPGEIDVAAVAIGTNQYRLTPWPENGLLEYLFSPICADGLIFSVKLRKEAQFTSVAKERIP